MNRPPRERAALVIECEPNRVKIQYAARADGAWFVRVQGWSAGKRAWEPWRFIRSPNAWLPGKLIEATVFLPSRWREEPRQNLHFHSV